MNKAKVVKELEKLLKGYDSHAEFCRKHKIDPAALSKVLAGRLDPPPCILKPMELEKVEVVFYRRKAEKKK